jgi:putative endonuclease
MQEKEDPRIEIGQRAEQLAVEFLEDKGLTIAERNYRGRRGEVDIIALDGDTVVMVEVRSATTRYLRSPSITVNREKQRHIVLGAHQFLIERHMERHDVRFDVVAVHFASGTIRIEWLPGAFRPEPTAVNPRFR